MNSSLSVYALQSYGRSYEFTKSERYGKDLGCEEKKGLGILNHPREVIKKKKVTQAFLKSELFHHATLV